MSLRGRRLRGSFGRARRAGTVAGLLAALGCSTPTLPDQRSGPALRAVSWDYHYDRNALTASVGAGAHLVALTEAGHILRFDRGTLALTGEWLSPRIARALGAATDADVVVGFENGQIARLDVAT